MSQVCPGHSWLGKSASVDIRYDSVRHTFAVFLPGTAILSEALLFVSGLPVHQQCSEVEEVEVGEQVAYSCGERAV